MKRIAFLILLFFTSGYFIGQTSFIWNGLTSTNWNTNTNWTPNGIPGAVDNVTIVTGANNCVIAGNTTVTNLTISSGLLNLNSFSLTTTGIVACTSGTCNNGTFNSTATSLTFGGTTFGANIIATVGDVYFNGSTFNGNVNVTKTSASNVQSNGNNVYNGTTSITNAGTGYLLLTNGAVGRNETFNGPASFNTTNTGALYIGYGRDVYLNANISTNNPSGTGLIQIGRVGTVFLNSAITLTCSAFTGAALNLYNFVQTGSTSQTLSPGDGGAVNIYGSAINGSLIVNAGRITAQTSTFVSSVTYIMGGTTGNSPSSGGNTYGGVLTVNNSSSGYIGFANGTSDIYNGDVYLNNTSNAGGRIILGQNSSNNQFNQNIYVSQSGTSGASGISIGWGGTYPIVNIAPAKNIFVNGVFDSGYLQLYRLQQNSATTISLTTMGTSLVRLQDNIFSGAVNITAPDIIPSGGTYNNAVSFIKTGGGSGNHNNGNQNIFNSTLYLENQSNTGYILLSYNSADQFNDDITVVSSGSGGISLGWTGGSGAPILAANKTISVGVGGFSAGYLQLGSLTQIGSAPINLTLTGTASFHVVKSNTVCTFNSPISVTAPDIYIRGGVFNNTAYFKKTGGTSNHNNGELNIFNSTCTIEQQSTTGYFMLGYNSNDLFNDNIIITNTGTQGINLGYSSGTGNPVLAAGKTVSVGAAGFSGGYLYFGMFTQLGNTPINLNFTGSSAYIYYKSSVFGGNVTSVSPSVFFNASTFSGTLSATKTGPGNDASPGGNTFIGASEFVNSGSGYLLLGNGVADTWNNDVTFTNTGSERILPCYNSVGNLFNGNIIVNSTGSSIGINFCSIAAATATLAASKTIQVGALTFSSGYLILQRFTQLGNAPLNLTLLAGSNYLQFGPSSTIGGNVISTSPGLFFSGCLFSGLVTSTKNGTSNDQSIGNNIFNGVTDITNSGSGYLMSGNGNSDQFNTTANFNNLGSSHIYVAYNSSNNVFGGQTTFNNSPTSTNSWIYVASNVVNNATFNGNIIVNNNNGGGIYFGSSTGTSTLSAGYTIGLGAGVFNSGQLILRKFTQISATSQNITTTGTSLIQYGPFSSFDGDVTSVSPGLLFNGSVFNSSVTCTKNGTTSDASAGTNIFNGITNMTNLGSGYLLFGNGNSDQFNTTATFNNLGSSHIYVAHNSSNNVFGGLTTFNNLPTATNSWIYIAYYAANNATFNGNIVLNNNNGGGIYFGASTGDATLSTGNTISIGAGGFNSGQLILRRFTQISPTSQNITTTGTSLIQYGPFSSFDGNITSVSPGLLFHGTAFNNSITCTKNGSTNDYSNGGNVFNGATSLTNNGSGYLLMAGSSSDAYNNNLDFIQGSTGSIYPNYNTNCTYSGNVTISSTLTPIITFGSNTNGIATFNGGLAQTINKSGNIQNPVFTRLVINKTANDVTLSTRINISSSLTLNQGIINTTSVNILNMNNASNTTIGNALSYINGPMNYDMAFNGTRTLNFPIGKINDWRPSILTVRHNSGTSYTYLGELTNSSAQALGWALPSTVSNVSLVHYWDFIRKNTSTSVITPTLNLIGNQIITLFYDTNDGVNDPTNLTVCKNTYTSSSSWIDIGGSGATITTGSVTSTSSPSAFNSFSRFTLGNKDGGINPLPIELLSFNATGVNNKVNLEWATASENNNDYFMVERSRDGVNFEFVNNIKAYGTGNSSVKQSYKSIDETPFTGISYYRLKQFDRTGIYTNSNIISVALSDKSFINVYPNPTSDKLYINTSENYNNAYVKVLSANGSLVKFEKQLSFYNGVINLSDLASGIYFVIIDNGISTKNLKISLQK